MLYSYCSCNGLGIYAKEIFVSWSFYRIIFVGGWRRGEKGGEEGGEGGGGTLGGEGR